MFESFRLTQRGLLVANSGSLSLEQVLKWALYSKDKNTDLPVPMESKCEGCWKAWSQCFHHLEWQDFCQRYKGQRTFEELVLEVKSKLDRHVEPVAGPSVTHITSFSLEASRDFLLASERELKNLLGQSRLNKWQMAGVPSIELPGESGAKETCYVFRDPSQSGLRQFKVKCHMDVSTAATKMHSNSSMFPEHSELVFQDIVQQGTSTLSQLFTMKEDQLLTHDSWFQTRAKRSEADEGDDDQVTALEENVELSGVAASS
eukprot:6491057-Amphidinium_carterae.1